MSSIQDKIDELRGRLSKPAKIAMTSLVMAQPFASQGAELPAETPTPQGKVVVFKDTPENLNVITNLADMNSTNQSYNSVADNIEKNLETIGVTATYNELQQQIKDGSLEPNTYDWSGKTPLMWAAEKDYTIAADLLMRCGADPNLTTPQFSPELVRSVENSAQTASNPEMVNYFNNLMLYNNYSTSGQTAVFYAKSTDMLNFLSANGADLNQKDSKGHQALYYWDGSNAEVGKYLLNAGNDASNLKDSATDLSYKGSKRAIFAMQNGLSEKKDMEKYFRSLIERNDVEGIKDLMDLGAKPNKKIKEFDKSAKELAEARTKHPEVLETLNTYQPNSRNNEKSGYTISAQQINAWQNSGR